MLAPTQISIINEQLDKENVHEFVETLILAYASDVKRTSDLLSLIPTLAEKQLHISNTKIVEYSNTVNLLIGDRNTKRPSKKYNLDFPTLLYTSKVHFPNGNCEGHSSAEKEFFNDFINAIKNKIGFDYESVDDWNWICNIADCEDWMRAVIRQNIDEMFQDPQFTEGC